MNNTFHLLSMMVLLTSASLSSSAADLVHIDRDIAREPSTSRSSFPDGPMVRCVRLRFVFLCPAPK
jgi:hypothetical protein